MKIEVLYFEGCPNHQPAVEALESVLDELGIATRVESTRVRDQSEAAATAFIGSPTIRIDGVDVEPADTPSVPRMACRVYRTSDGIAGVPDRATLAAALRKARGDRNAEMGA